MSSTEFRARIRASIANASLQEALDANAERRVNGRLAAFASLPDWRERRQQAHAIRADVIEHLESYLEQFCEKARANGMIVHHAHNAPEAVGIVLELARQASWQSTQQRRQPLVAKSKSMVSEEIELNDVLEREGIRVVETDLGEYIVQLRGEKPAHIITPAVHLRRHEVGRLFQEKLGLPYTEDIPTLTAAARKLLREVFLGADVGVSGVNFGVAETGTLCIVTNEGNGRMVTTLPPIHIALMGMERLLPTLEDLAIMLSLLPRSATGQKLSVYTQLLHSPRRAGEADGAAERHIVIVDNGRSQLRDSALREALYCIRCGACLNACPVFREIGGHAYVGTDGSIAPYPGPIGSVVSPGLLGLDKFGDLAQASSLCGACKDACPVDIDLPKLLTRVRAGGGENGRHTGVGLTPVSRFGLNLYGFIGASPNLFRISQALGALATRMLSPFSEWMRVPRFTGWGYSKDFPRVAGKTFHKWFRHMPPVNNASTHSESEGREVPGQSREAAQTAVEQFVMELQALGGSTYRVSAADLEGKLIEFLEARGVDEILAWDTVEGIDERHLRAAGISVVHTPDPRPRAGLTEAAAAISLTGTLLITSGPGTPLTTSLLPEIHVAIVPSVRIVRSLEEVLRRPDVSQASAAVLISGPSRTADIEMTLTIGVHGPRELVVFVVE